MRKNRIAIYLSFVLFMFVSAFGGIGYYYMSVKEIVSHQANDFIMAVTESRANHIRTLLDEQVEKIKLITENALIEAYLEQGSAFSELDLLQSELNEYLDVELVGVSVTDREGIILISSHPDYVGEPIALEELAWERDRAEDVIGQTWGKERSILFRDVYHSQLLDTDIFELGAYVMSEENDEPIGMIKVDFDSQILDNVTLDRKGLGESGEIYLINHQGYTITPRIFKTQADLTEIVDTPNSAECLEDLEEDDPEAEEREKEEDGDLRMFTASGGDQKIGVDVPIYRTGWCLLGEYKERELYGLLNLKLLTVALPILIFITIITGVFIFVIDKLSLGKHKS